MVTGIILYALIGLIVSVFTPEPVLEPDEIGTVVVGLLWPVFLFISILCWLGYGYIQLVNFLRRRVHGY